MLDKETRMGILKQFVKPIKKKKCMVCLGLIEPEENVATCPDCENDYHHGHLMEWLNKKGECPICQTDLHVTQFPVVIEEMTEEQAVTRGILEPEPSAVRAGRSVARAVGRTVREMRTDEIENLDIEDLGLEASEEAREMTEGTRQQWSAGVQRTAHDIAAISDGANEFSNRFNTEYGTRPEGRFTAGEVLPAPEPTPEPPAFIPEEDGLFFKDCPDMAVSYQVNMTTPSTGMYMLGSRVPLHQMGLQEITITGEFYQTGDEPMSELEIGGGNVTLTERRGNSVTEYKGVFTEIRREMTEDLPFPKIDFEFACQTVEVHDVP